MFTTMNLLGPDKVLSITLDQRWPTLGPRFEVENSKFLVMFKIHFYHYIFYGEWKTPTKVYNI